MEIPTKQVSVELTTQQGYDNAKLEIIPNMSKNIKGISPDEYVLAKKGEYSDPLEKTGKFGTYYIASFEVQGTPCVMFLKDKEEADSFAQAGGIDDEIKVFWINVPYVYQGVEKFKQRVRFAPARGE